MGKTLNTILVTACLGLVSGASFVAGRGYERTRQAPPTVRFAEHGVRADIYLDEEFTTAHTQRELESAIGFGLANAAGNLSLTGPAYQLAITMDYVCVEKKAEFLFGKEDRDLGPSKSGDSS